MITIEENPPDLLVINVSGILSHRDIRQLMPVLKKYAPNSIRPRLLLVAKNFQGWYGAGPWWSDLALNDECGCKLVFGRIALIGDPKWRVWMTTFVHSLTYSSEIKFFSHGEISGADEWLNSQSKSGDTPVRLTT